MSTAYIITDLGFGDSGKGSITDYLCSIKPINWVIRYNGGAQAAHTVYFNDLKHTFSTYGSGSFRNVKTYLSEHFIVNFPVLAKETNELSDKGINNPLSLLEFHPDCKVTTPWHIGLNHLQELARGANSHGSCGMGIGTTMEDYINNPDTVLLLKDTTETGELYHKLSAIYARLLHKANELIPQIAPSVYLEVAQDLFNSQTLQSFFDTCKHFSPNLTLSIDPWKTSDTVVFEGAQGVLLDENFGFHPHTTWSTTTSKNAKTLALKYGFKPIVFGLLRAYQSRHGAGPFPTEGSVNFPDLNNPFNPWQKTFRTGALDFNLLQYAIQANNGVDFLVVSHLDELPTTIPVCLTYQSKLKLSLPTTLDEQETLGDLLATAQPTLTTIPHSSFITTIENNFKLPVAIVSYGVASVNKKLLLNF